MLISVIIPVFNGGETFRRCLEALCSSRYERWECVVVDDGSTDNSRETALNFGAKVVRTAKPQSGPALARNLGVQSAKGEVLFFIDSDVLVKEDTLDRVAEIMADEKVAACIGSYDDRPTAENFLSQYRNLLHHYTHQKSNREAATFWSGCGAIRREIFFEAGGFSALFARPSFEDIELGYRLRAEGHHIILEKDLQVGHMKKWTAVNVLVTDIRDRAVPWARLILAEGTILKDLNLAPSQRVSSAAALAGLLALLASPFFPYSLVVIATAIVVLLFLNRHFYSFLRGKRGNVFALWALVWHWLYFVYSGLSFGFCFLWYRVLRVENPLVAVPEG
jgi:glycosyltransferase involved in cell wall biosynthesis